MSDIDSGRESPECNNYRPTNLRHPALIDNDQNTQLHYAAAQNDLQKVQNLVEKEKHEIDPENYLGWTPLMMACRKGHLKIVRYLVARRANTTKKNKFGMNMLHVAISSGNLELVEYITEFLLSGGIPRRSMENDLATMSLAVLFDHPDILSYLIENGFDINKATSETGITPLMVAHALENQQAIMKFQQNKVDTEAKNYLQQTANDITTVREKIKFIPNSDSKVAVDNLQTEKLKHILKVNDKTEQKNGQDAPKYPWLVITPSNPSLLMPGQFFTRFRHSSNISPGIFTCTPQVSPIVGYEPQVFFPPDFVPTPPNFSPLNPATCFNFDDNDLLNADADKFKPSA